MKKISYILFVLTILSTSFISCSEDEIDKGKTVIDFSDKKGQNTDFDKFLEENYRKKYNIDFVYRLTEADKNMRYILAPAEVEKSIKIANLIKYICLESYDKVAPSNFLKKYFPKRLVIVGSPAVEGTTLVQGTAEKGLEITLYNINNLDETNIEKLKKDYFHLIFHEFSHIMHTKVDYSQAFREITPEDYRAGAWTQLSEADAKKKGFVSNYASKNFNEDFVETLAFYITYEDSKWQKILADAGSEGADKITKKITIVKDYMKNVWKIDLDLLKAEIKSRIDNLPNVDINKIK